MIETSTVTTRELDFITIAKMDAEPAVEGYRRV